MDYKGVIIEESLETKDVLKGVLILNTKVEAVTEKHQTPWIQKWTLHTVSIPEEKISDFAQGVSKSLDREHNWYADFKNELFHYIVYRDRVFKVDLKNPILYKEARKYGISLGIPEYQVDFAPTGVIFALVREGRILMQQRDENCKRFPLMWCLPGGASEQGESSKETLIREVKEEYDLDLQIEQCSYLMDYHDGADKVYTCRLTEEQEPKLQEGLAMKWMTIDEIEKLELGFHQKGIIPVLKKEVL